jgi:hypothetical protein
MNIGIQKTSTREKNIGANQRAYSTTFGLSTSVGYQGVSGKFLLGIEAGLDFGSFPSQLKISNRPNENSIEHLKRHYALSQIITSYCRTMFPFALGGAPSLDGSSWRNFLMFNRYLGGSNSIVGVGGVAGPFTLANPDGTPGSAISAFIHAPSNAGSPTFIDYVEQNTINSISFMLGNGNLESALREVRNYVVSSNPDLATTLRSICETSMTGVVNSAIDDNDQGLGINALAPTLLTTLFAGGAINDLAAIGISNSAPLLGNDISRTKNAINWALAYNGADPLAASKLSAAQIKTRTVFGMSPYAAFKVGYFFDELDACLYIKAGVIQMKGRIVSLNSNFSTEENNFRKAAPFLAIGLGKKLQKDWGINFEILRSLKVSKELTISSPYGFSVKNKVSISKTSFSVVLTFAM